MPLVACMSTEVCAVDLPSAVIVAAWVPGESGVDWSETGVDLELCLFERSCGGAELEAVLLGSGVGELDWYFGCGSCRR